MAKNLDNIVPVQPVVSEENKKPNVSIIVKPAEKKLLKQAKKVKKNQAKQIKKGSSKIKPRLVFVGKVFVLCFLFLLFLSAASVGAYKNSFKTRAYYGIKILGEDFGGKNEKEIKLALDKKIEAITFSFAIDGTEVVVKPNEAGIKFNAGKTAREAIAEGKTGKWHDAWLYPAGSLVQKMTPSVQALSLDDFRSNFSLSYEIDEQKLTDFTQSLSLRFNQDSKNAGLVMTGTEVQVIPAVAGRKIVTESVKAQIAESVAKVKSEKIKIEMEKVNPAILDSDTKQSIEEAKTILGIPVKFTYNEKTFSPDKQTVGSWIIFETTNVGGKDYLKPSIDPKKVYPYVYGLSGQINIQAINKKVTIKNGAEQVVEQEGKDGLAVDVDKASATTAQLLSVHKPVSLELPTYAVKSKTTVNNIVVADWAKYIDINLSSQTMCAYLAGGEQVACWAITSGQSGMNTPTGTHLIRSKSGAGGAPGASGGGVCMPNPPSPYPLCGINWVSYFTAQGHAIHEAWWRSSFGSQDYLWNGSHGCVNAPYSVAQFIYNWAPIGTPVVIHY